MSCALLAHPSQPDMALEITHPSSEDHARHVSSGYATASLYLHRFLDKLTRTLDDPEQVFTTGREIAEARLMLNVLDQLRPSTFTGDSTNAQLSPVKVEPSTLDDPLSSAHDTPLCDAPTRELQPTTCGGQSCLQSQTRTPRPSRQGAFVGTPDWDAMANVYGRPESRAIERATAAAASIMATSGEPSQHEPSTRACPTEATWTVCRGPTSVESAQTTQTPPDTTISELCAASSNTPVQAPSSTLSSPRSSCSSTLGKRARSPSTSVSDSSHSSHLDGASDYRSSAPSPDLPRKLRRVSGLRTLRLCDASSTSADPPSSTSTSTSYDDEDEEGDKEHESNIFDIMGPSDPEAFLVSKLCNVENTSRGMRELCDAIIEPTKRMLEQLRDGSLVVVEGPKSTDKRSSSEDSQSNQRQSSSSPSHSAASPCSPPSDTQEKEPAQTIVAVAASEIPAQS